jgi:serine/tyrosine/threonine adenylyltransferase
MNSAVLSALKPSLDAARVPVALVPYDCGLTWQPGFLALGSAFYTRLQPQPMREPYWVGKSTKVAELLGLPSDALESTALLNALTGNLPLQGAQPLASVYSGHQFGQWAGQLGDGRAILLGETSGHESAQAGQGFEVQLKGAGLTPYSRMGDGRAVLRSSIREFLCSEAMHALGIPTSRALCVTGSDSPVRREEIETAAVVTRVAPSFIRFGHFEHFSHSGAHDELKALADYVIDRYYPACRDTNNPALARLSGNSYAVLLEAVSEKTALMVAHWQSVGFCHGVMNTDNMSILGLTIDYGPFQFLDAYVPGHICNHSDTSGRYAFNKQPNIAYWNLYALGQALLPLIGEQDLAVAALESYKTVFPTAFEDLMRRKLGLAEPRDGDRPLIEATLKLLAQEKVDYTIFWRRLSQHAAGADRTTVRDLFIDGGAFDAWMLHYSEQTIKQIRGQSHILMLKTNPKFVLRNHLGEEAIRAAKLKDFSRVNTLLSLLESPCEEHPGFEAYADFPPAWASGIEISCSS